MVDYEDEDEEENAGLEGAISLELGLTWLGELDFTGR